MMWFYSRVAGVIAGVQAATLFGASYFGCALLGWMIVMAIDFTIQAARARKEG